MKPLIYLSSFIGHYLDGDSIQAAHSYAVSRVRCGRISSLDTHIAVMIVLAAIVLVSGVVAGVLK